MKKTLIAVIALVLVIAAAVLVTHKKSGSTVITVSYPTPGTTWSFSSKQKISWSVANLPSGDYNAVAYLTNLKDRTKGYLFSEPVTSGAGDANYVVNIYEDKNGNSASLPNGMYQFSLAVYKTPTANDYLYGYGDPKDLVAEKDGGAITITDSDVGAATSTPMVGNDRDAHGCIPSAGYSWCASKSKCLRPWEESCPASPAR